MEVTPVATAGHEDAQGQISSGWCLRTKKYADLHGLCCYQMTVISGPELQLRAMSGSMTQLQPGFMLMFKDPAAWKAVQTPETMGHVGI